MPSPTPQRDVGESADQYADRIVLWARTEIDRLAMELQGLGDIQVALEAPRAPYDGMVRWFDAANGWSPDSGAAPYVFIEGEWWKISVAGPYAHN